MVKGKGRLHGRGNDKGEGRVLSEKRLFICSLAEFRDAEDALSGSPGAFLAPLALAGVLSRKQFA